MGREFAPIVRRRRDVFPFASGDYFDLRKWGHGYARAGMGRGAIVLCAKAGRMLNMASGEVYIDDRFKEQAK